MESADTSRAAEASVDDVQEITFDEVLRAGRVLFGPRFAAEAGAWRDALRSTYRRRALETHPDRARALGRAERELAREFHAVAEAYRVLSSLRAGALPRPFDARGPARPRAASSPPPASASAPRPWAPPRAPRSAGPRPWTPPRAARPPSAGPRVRASVRPQDLPRRRLRFAEFLYYTGRVRWSELAEAIAWQRAQRPPLGRIAVEFGFLGPDDVGVILERRREAGAHVVPFGEWALRLGYLSSFQLLATLGQQLRRQRRIGQFFVERGLLGEEEIEELRRRILRHNAGYGG